MCIVRHIVRLRALQNWVKNWPSEMESAVSHHLGLQLELLSVTAVLLVIEQGGKGPDNPERVGRRGGGMIESLGRKLKVKNGMERSKISKIF